MAKGHQCQQPAGKRGGNPRWGGVRAQIFPPAWRGDEEGAREQPRFLPRLHPTGAGAGMASGAAPHREGVLKPAPLGGCAPRFCTASPAQGASLVGGCLPVPPPAVVWGGSLQTQPCRASQLVGLWWRLGGSLVALCPPRCRQRVPHLAACAPSCTCTSSHGTHPTACAMHPPNSSGARPGPHGSAWRPDPARKAPALGPAPLRLCRVRRVLAAAPSYFGKGQRWWGGGVSAGRWLLAAVGRWPPARGSPPPPPKPASPLPTPAVGKRCRFPGCTAAAAPQCAWLWLCAAHDSARCCWREGTLACTPASARQH